jgi:TRAP-type C4-dicarboxylate transport system permease small subunit
MEVETNRQAVDSLDPAVLEGPVERICKVLCGATDLLLLCFTAQEIFARMFLNRSLEMSEELGGYCLVIIGMLGLPLCVAHDSFQKTEFVRNWLSPRARIVSRILIDAVTLLAGLVLIWQYGRYFMSSYSAGYFNATRLQTPQWLPIIPMVLGTLVFILTLSKAIFIRWRMLSAANGS